MKRTREWTNHLPGYYELSIFRKFKITFICIWRPVAINLNQFTGNTGVKGPCRAPSTKGVSPKTRRVMNTHTGQTATKNRNKLCFSYDNVRACTVTREKRRRRCSRRQVRTHSKVCTNRAQIRICSIHQWKFKQLGTCLISFGPFEWNRQAKPSNNYVSPAKLFRGIKGTNGIEIRAKRKKANRNAQEKTKSWGEFVAHLIKSRSNSGVTGGARDGACLTIRSRPRKVNFNSGVS